MPRNGAGVFTPPATAFPAVPNTLIESTKFNNLINDITTALTGSVAADGQTTVTADIPLNSHKLTGLVAGSGSGHSVEYAQMNSAIAAYKAFKLTSVSASVASNALTVQMSPCTLEFRSTTLTDGLAVTRVIAAAISVVAPLGATLGTSSGHKHRLALLAIDNAGTVELAVANIAALIGLDETSLISTTAISAAANSGLVIYSTTARTNVAFRVVGFVESVQTTAGTWAAAPTKVQGYGNQSFFLPEHIYPEMFGAVSSTTVTSTAAFAACLAFCKQYGFEMRIKDKDYALDAESSGLNFIGAGLKVIGEGKPRLYFIGAGRGFIADAKVIGGAGASYGGMRIENLILIGNPVITKAWYSSGIVRSNIRNIEARECTTYAFDILFSVSTHFDSLKYSTNEAAGTTKPTYGARLGNDGVGFYCADNTFTNLILEGTTYGTGLYLYDAAGNTFNGGTFEACTRGLHVGAASIRNHFNGVWMEANSLDDISLDGASNTFTNCHLGSSASSTLNLQVGAGKGNVFTGGYVRAANLTATSSDTSFNGVGFNENTGGTLGIQGSGTYTNRDCTKINTAGAVVGRLQDKLGFESTVTVTMTCGTSGTITLNPAFNSLFILKEGRKRTVTGRLLVDSVVSPVGDLMIAGLPEASATGAAGYASATVSAYGLAATATTSVIGLISPSTTTINLLKYSAGGIANLAGDVQAGTVLIVTLTYFV